MKKNGKSINLLLFNKQYKLLSETQYIQQYYENKFVGFEVQLIIITIVFCEENKLRKSLTHPIAFRDAVDPVQYCYCSVHRQQNRSAADVHPSTNMRPGPVMPRPDILIVHRSPMEPQVIDQELLQMVQLLQNSEGKIKCHFKIHKPFPPLYIIYISNLELNPFYIRQIITYNAHSKKLFC